ncbi:MAG: tetratricopeptide repeat protein [Candidatus Hodarchaeota archaeon]
MSLPEILANAKLLRVKGKFSEALKLLEESWPQLVADQKLEIASYNERSLCLWRIGELEKAEIHAQKALQLAEERLHDLQGRGDAFRNLGIISWFRGDLDRAEKFFQQSLTLREEVGNPADIAASLHNLGLIHFGHGDLDQAEEFFQRSLTLREEVGNPSDIAASLNNLGELYRQRGELDRAEDCYRRSLALAEQDGNPTNIAIYLNNLGEFYRQRGELNQAESYYQQSLTIREKVGNPADIAASLNNLGLIYWQRGNLREAENCVQRSLSLKEKIGNAESIAETRHQLIRILLAQNSVDRAITEENQLARLAESSEKPEVHARHLLAQCLLSLEKLNFPQALASGSQARILAGQIPHFELEVDSLQLLVQIHLKLQLISQKAEHRAYVESLLQELKDLSERERLHGVFCETILIQGFLKRADYDLPGAMAFFKQVEHVAEEHGLQLLAHRASEELTHLQQEIATYQQLQKLSPQAYKQLQMQEMLTYMEEAKRYLQLQS